MKLALYMLMLLFVSLGLSSAGPRDLYMATTYQQVYDKGQTRSPEGRPGTGYWINHARYTIDVTVYPSTRLLKGRAVMVYSNESPDTLKKLVLRLYQDIYRKGNTRNESVDPLAVTDGMEILCLKVGDKRIDTDDPAGPARRRGTNLFIDLEKPLLPGGKRRLEIEWKYYIAEKSRIRSGMYDKSTAFVAYWYPQIAVYDDVFGWDILNYNGLQEFYNDFHDFDVRINVPAGYSVWATGILQNPGEILPSEQFDVWKRAFESDETQSLLSGKILDEDSVVVNEGAQSWHFKAGHVPDFAFSFSDHYAWDIRSVEVEPGRRTLIQAAYPKDDENSVDVCEIAAGSIAFLSGDFPAIPYPYEAMTVFISKNGGGMEFPMIVNDGSVEKHARRVSLTSHEITHTYFPFMMGINERRFAFMDEGMAVMLPFKAQLALAPEENIVARRVKRYNKIGGSVIDMPMMIPSYDLAGPAYRNASYNRPGMAYEYLRQILGDKLFLKALHDYVQNWRGKHPLPYDFFHTFNRVSGENLNWYWKPWFFEFAYADLALGSVSKTAGGLDVVVRNKGGLPLPVRLTVTDSEGREKVVEKTAAVWREANGMVTIHVPEVSRPVKVVLGGETILDADTDNNIKENF